MKPSLKPVALLILAFVLLYSCRKEKVQNTPPPPSYAERIEGTYSVTDTVFTDGSCSEVYTSFDITISKVSADTVYIVPFHCSDTLIATVDSNNVRVLPLGNCYYDRLYGTIEGNTIYFTYRPGFAKCWIYGQATAIKQE